MAENKMKLGLPDGMQMQQRNDELTLSYSWLGTKHFFAVLHLLIFCGFYWFSMRSNPVDLESLWQNKLQLCVLLLIIGTAYFAALGFVNKTRLQVTHNRLKISHGPLPCLLSKTAQSSDFAQLYVKKDVHQSRSNNSIDVSYRLQVISKQGKTLTLIKGIQTSEDALYVEQEIESFLGIKNQPVQGEFS